ncbi:MAG: hypothetical protein K2Q24_13185 [Chitinophagaceae bacterium]|nr:hypothetical protein [Chitinophagaceae bacterium]
MKFNTTMAGKLYKRLVKSKTAADSAASSEVSGQWSVVHRLFLLLTGGLCLMAFAIHPYYMSVTEAEYKAAEKEIQISSKIFIDDLEYALEQEYKTKVEILKATDQKRNELLLTSFFQRHLKFTVDGKPMKAELIGFEREGEAIWTYLMIKNVSKLKSVTVFSDLLYAYREDQINIIHFKHNNQRKSHRLTLPDKQVTFNW